MRQALLVGTLAMSAALGTIGTAVAATVSASQARIEAATAVPAQASTSVASSVPIKGSGNFASPTGRVVPNVNPVAFSCSFISLVPFQTFQFNCTVQSGRLQLFLVCTNGARVFSPVMPAINTYFPVPSCPAGTQATAIMWQAV